MPSTCTGDEHASMKTRMQFPGRNRMTVICLRILSIPKEGEPRKEVQRFVYSSAKCCNVFSTQSDSAQVCVVVFVPEWKLVTNSCEV